MKSEPDWNKRSTIAEYLIGIPTFAITLAAYLFPRDPAHPASFDFLSRSVTVPLWVVILAASVWLVGIVMLFVRRKRNNGEILPEFKTSQPKAASASDVIKPLIKIKISKPPSTQSVSTTPWEDELGQMIIPSGDGIDLKIRREELGGPQKGLVLQVLNNRLESIAGQRISISHAVSFDRWHSAYRQEVDFKPFAGNIDNVVTPASVSTAMWIIRSEPSTPNLIVGNTSSSELI